MKQCKALKANGQRCTQNVIPGSEYCRHPSHQALALGDEARERDKMEVLTLPRPELPDDDNVCGHKNLHATFKDPQGLPYNLACELEKGHEGDHSAHYHAIDYKNMGVTRSDPNAVTHWKDEAGTPIEDITPDLRSLPRTDPRHPNSLTQAEIVTLLEAMKNEMRAVDTK